MTLKEHLAYQPNGLQFGTSGLRGLISDMTDLECYINVAGFLHFLKKSNDTFSTVYISGDLRKSTPRILQIVAQAIRDNNVRCVYVDTVPTPALAYQAARENSPCIMVTGSHIPDDRNGIKFYTQDGEVMKSDEVDIRAAVALVREEIYNQESHQSSFDENGRYTKELPDITTEFDAARVYVDRYTSVFGSFLKGRKIVLYQHSAVGRDLMVVLLKQLGAEVVCEGRSEEFIPIDTENVKPEDARYFKSLAQKHPDAFAILSTDGDGDRPFLIDETGTFHRGDVIGIYTARFIGADAVALPVSTNDAADEYLGKHAIHVQKTRIGSPYVIEAMQSLNATYKKVSGWEVNGGFLLGTNTKVLEGELLALPTRDAVLPQLACMAYAIEQNKTLSDLFAELPQRYTQAGLIDNFSVETSQKLITVLQENNDATHRIIESIFSSKVGFGALQTIDTTDGIRMRFDGGDVVHIRPSGNAPQLRVYTNCNSQQRADELVAAAIAEPRGYLRQLEELITR